MKTTLELPESLVEEVRVRASREGQELEETLVGLVKKGLEVTGLPSPRLEPSVVTRSSLGFPLIAGGRPAKASEELTPKRVADLLLAQEVTWHDEAARH
jgi:hypothetical protein